MFFRLFGDLFLSLGQLPVSVLLKLTAFEGFAIFDGQLTARGDDLVDVIKNEENGKNPKHKRAKINGYHL